MLIAGFSGYVRQDEDYNRIVRPSGSGDYIFLYFPKPMKHILNGKTCISKPHACIFYAPTDAQDFCGIPEFINSFVHFKDTSGEMTSYRIQTSKLFYPDCYKQLNELTGQIQAETLLQNKHHKEMGDALLRRLLILTDRSISPEASDPQREIFEKMRFELLSNISDNTSIDEIAKKMCMSRSQFYAKYKGYFGTTPKQDILRARMEKASTLLSNKAKTVSCIAHELGFNNTEHFSRYYKQYFGVTPREKN